MSFDQNGDTKNKQKLANTNSEQSNSSEEPYEDFEASSGKETLLEVPSIERSLVEDVAPPKTTPSYQNKEGDDSSTPDEEGEWASRLAAAKAFGVIDSHPFLQSLPYDEEEEEPVSQTHSEEKKPLEAPISQETLDWLGEIEEEISSPVPLDNPEDQFLEGPPTLPMEETPHEDSREDPSSAKNYSPIENAEEENVQNPSLEKQQALYHTTGQENFDTNPNVENQAIASTAPPLRHTSQSEQTTTSSQTENDSFPKEKIQTFEMIDVVEEASEVSSEEPSSSPLAQEVGENSAQDATGSFSQNKQENSMGSTEEELIDEENISLLIHWSKQLPEEQIGQSQQEKATEAANLPPVPLGTGKTPPLPTPALGTGKPLPKPPFPSMEETAEATEETATQPAKRSLADLDLPPELFEPETPKENGSTHSPSQAATVQLPKLLPRGWWDTIFNEDFLRTNPAKSEAMTRKEADFIESSLLAKQGDAILDVACGYGRHVIELAERGYQMVGLDLSLPYLMLAAEIATRRKLIANFVHGDMRDLQFKEYFDSAYCVFTSFGYFDDASNLEVLHGINRSLKPKSRLLIEIVNRDFAVIACPLRGWWEGVGCVMLEETEFDYLTSLLSTRRSVIFEDGRQAMQETHVRLYSLHELSDLLKKAGFKILEVSGGIDLRGVFFGADSTHLVVLAEKQR